MNSDLYFNGKKYISAKRAAEVSGYADDYIGQLCRSKKLESKMVGRSWFVSEESLFKYFDKQKITVKSASEFIESEDKNGEQKSEISEISSSRDEGKTVSDESNEFDKIGERKNKISATSSSRDEENAVIGRSGEFVYMEDKGPLIPEIVSKESPAPVIDTKKNIRGRKKNILQSDNKLKSPLHKNAEHNFHKMLRTGAMLAVFVLVVLAGAGALNNFSFVKDAREKISSLPVDFLKAIVPPSESEKFYSERYSERRDENKVLALIKKTPLYFETGLRSSIDEAANVYHSLAGKFGIFNYDFHLTGGWKKNISNSSTYASVSSSLNDFSLKIYRGTNNLFSDVKNYFGGFFGGENKFADNEIIPIKQSGDATASYKVESPSSSSSADSSDSNNSKFSYNLQPTTYNLKPDITRREVLDLIKQYDDNSKALIYAANAITGENSLIVNQTVSDLKNKINSLEQKGTRQIDHVYNSISRSFSEITSLDGVAMTNSSFSGTTISGATGTFTGTLSGATGIFSGNIGIGTTSPNWKLSVAGIGSFDDNVRASYFTATSTTATSTFAGRLLATKAPTLPHTFSVWDTDAVNSNVTDSSFLINPSSVVADSNLFGIAVGGNVKFLVDAEGDVFVRNLTATGTVNQANTNISTLTVENATNLGDADTDALTIHSGIWSLTSTATSTVAMTNGLNFDSNTFVIDPNSNRIGIGTSSPYAKLSVVGEVVAQMFTATSTTATSTFPYLSITTNSNLGTVVGGTWQGTALTDSYISSAIAWNNKWDLASSTIPVNKGGTGQTAFGQGWLNSDGTTITSSTSPTVAYLTATSTTATSTFAGGATFATGGGNVGIGTANPQYKLEVAGKIYSNSAVGVGGNPPNGYQFYGTGAGPGFQFDNTDDGGASSYFTDVGVYGIAFSRNREPRLGGFVGSATSPNQYKAASFGLGNVQQSMMFNVANFPDGVANVRFMIDYNGNVGIGTTTPGSKLSVFGGGSFGANYGVAAPTNGLIVEGNVGIGNSSPTYKLDVSGLGHFTGLVDAPNFVATSTTATSTFAGGMNVAGTSGLTVLQNGKVGVGTNSPTANLHIYQNSPTAHQILFKIGTSDSASRFEIDEDGDVTFTPAQYSSFNVNGSGNGNNTIATFNAVGSDTVPLTSYANQGSNVDVTTLNLKSGNGSGGFKNSLRFSYGTTAHGLITSILRNISGSDLSFSTHNGGSAPVEIMRITKEENVGIGTTSPYAKLSVVGPVAAEYFHATSTTATSTFAGGMNVAGSSGLTVLQNGNVGVGTVSPRSKLSFGSIPPLYDTADQIRFYDNGTDDWYSIGTAITVPELRLTAGATGYITFFTGSSGGTEKVRINTSGNIGIGNSSPTYKLDVAGLGHFTGLVDAPNFVATSTSATSTFAGGATFATGGGNVGIGTITPNFKLTVNGNMNISDGSGLVVGHTAKVTVSDRGGVTDAIPEVQIIGAESSVSDSSLLIGQFNAAAASQYWVSPTLGFLRSAGSTMGSVNRVSQGHNLGEIIWYGADGASLKPVAAGIRAIVDGTPGVGDMPGALLFLTTLDGEQGATERMRINNAGKVGIGTSIPDSKLTVFASADDSAIEFSSASGSTYKWTMGLDYSDGGKFKIASSTALGSIDRFTIDGNGYVGIGTSTPARRLDVADSGTNIPQLRLSRESNIYTDFSVAQTTGDLALSLYGANANDVSLLMPDGSTGANLWVCEGAACPSVTLSDGGNIVVERDIKYPTSGRMKRSIVLTAAGAIIPTSGGATKTQVDGANSSYYVLDFGQTATTSAFWQWTIPDSYDGGSISATYYWFTTVTSGGVSWCSQTNGVNTAENINAALSDASCDATSNNVPTGSTNTLATTTQSSLTSNFTPGEAVTFKVSRGVDNTNDTAAADARLYMIKLEYGVSGESD